MAVAKNRHGPALHDLIHENADDVPVAVAEVLVFTINIVRPEDDVIQPKHFMRLAQVEFHRIFGDPIRVFRLGHEFLGHRQLIAAIDRDGRREHEAFHIVVHGGVDEIDAAEQVVGVIETFDEMTQALGGVGRQMENMFEPVPGKQLLYQRRVCDRTFNEFHTVGNLITKTAAQIIQTHHLMPLPEQVDANMRADESRRAGDQNLRTHAASLTGRPVGDEAFPV